MKVKELIKILSKCPQEVDVCNSCESEGYNSEVRAVAVFNDCIILSPEFINCYLNSIAFYTKEDNNERERTN